MDLPEPMLRRAVTHNGRTGASYVLGSAHALPFEADSFDAVACHGALYLIPEPFRAVDELVRVLRPGGRLAMMAAVASDTAGFRRLAQGVESETHGFFQYVSATAPA